MSNHVLQRRTPKHLVDPAPGSAVIVAADVLAVLQNAHVLGAEGGAPGGQAVDVPGFLVAAYLVHQQHGIVVQSRIEPQPFTDPPQEIPELRASCELVGLRFDEGIADQALLVCRAVFVSLNIGTSH